MRDRGELESAEQLLREGLALAEDQSDIYALSYLYSHLAITSLRANRPGEAIQRATKALEMRREAELYLWTSADLATLAAAHLAQDDLSNAVTYAEEAMALLDKCDDQGPELPQRDYLVCHHVLSAAGRREEAGAALERAHKLVQARAATIADPTLKTSFLEHVPVNHQIIQTYAQIVEDSED
jgi:tetratricopeptide (TPR) repeat protein